MGLSIDIIDQVSDRLKDVYQQVEFFQDQIVIIDDAKSTWDNAIYKIEGQLLGEMEIVNRAIDDVKDAYSVRFTGVNSCRSDLFWMGTNFNDTPTPNLYTFQAVALNENGYAGIMEQLAEDNPGGSLVGSGQTFFWYLNPATGIVTTAPTNAITGAEQSARGWDENTFRIGGFAPKNYYGIKYYDQRYAQDIGDTFVTSFIGTISPSSTRVTVLSPKDAVGIDTVFEVGQIISCGKTGVWGSTTKITGIGTGYTNLSQIPSLTGITTNSSLVNVLTVSTNSGLGVSAFDSVDFRVIDDPDTGPISSNGDVTSNGEVYKASQVYWAVPSSSNLGGRGATFSVFTNPSGGIATSGISTTIGGVQINGAQKGYGYATGEIITIEGGLIGGSTPADNISFQVRVGDRGRYRYSLPVGDDPDSIIDPFNPETVGIMQTANIGIGVSIALDNSGAPKGAQAWDPKNLGWDFSPKMDGSGIVYAPNVGADASYWRVGFQTAPIFQGNRVSAGDPTGSIQSNQLGLLLETLDACDSAVNTPITNAKAALTPIENSFNDEDGNHKVMIDASNGLRNQRNQMYLQIWGMRQSIGGLNEEITKLESIDSYVKNETIEDIIE
jgi:hypothetical protein